MKKYRIINKFRFFTIICITLAILLASMFFIVVNAKSINTFELIPVYVSEGDSLWQLSSQYSGGKMDIREYIDRVMNINNLSDANIIPGDLLMFPQYHK